MRKLARVWNLDDKPYSEKFKEKMIVIPAKEFVVMDIGEANSFMRSFTPVVRDTTGKDMQPKKLKMETFRTTQKVEQHKPTYICMVDSKEFPTQKAYDEHVKQEHMAQIVDKESREAFEEVEEAAHN